MQALHPTCSLERPQEAAVPVLHSKPSVLKEKALNQKPKAKVQVHAQVTSSLEAESYLLRCIHERLESGHWRVACRRYLMLLACQLDAPESLAFQCTELLKRVSHTQRKSMEEDARDWRDFLGTYESQRNNRVDAAS